MPALFATSSTDSFISPEHTYALQRQYGGQTQLVTFRGTHRSPRPMDFIETGLGFLSEKLHSPRADIEPVLVAFEEDRRMDQFLEEVAVLCEETETVLPLIPADDVFRKIKEAIRLGHDPNDCPHMTREELNLLEYYSKSSQPDQRPKLKQSVE